MAPLPGGAERADGWGHVYVFECVMDAPDDDDAQANGGAGVGTGLSLVQTIMAALGRKPSEQSTTKRSSSTPLSCPCSVPTHRTILIDARALRFDFFHPYNAHQYRAREDEHKC